MKILHIICYQGMQIKTIKHHCTLLEWPKSGTQTIFNAGEDVEQQELSFIANKKSKWYSQFGR